MSNKLSKKDNKDSKKIKFSKRSITIFCITIAIGLFIGLFSVLVLTDGLNKFINDSSKVEEIQIKANEFINKYDYNALVLDVLYTSPDNEAYRKQYLLSSEKDNEVHSYVCRDSVDASVYQCWSYDKDKKVFPLYIYSDEYETWVYCELESAPLAINPWGVVEDLSNYTLMDKTTVWGDTNDECYVLYVMSSSDEFEYIYEEVYIRKSDYAPMGIITYASETLDEERKDSLNDIDFDIEIKDAEISASQSSEIIQRYEFTYSNENLAFFEQPTKFITEEEYLLLESEKSEEESSQEGNKDES